MTNAPRAALAVYDSEAVAIREAGMALATQAEALVILDDETDVVAKTVLAAVTKGLKSADARRVELKAPALAECKAIDAAFGDATAPFKSAKDTISRKTGEYFKAKKEAEEAARREAERVEREAAAVRARAAVEAAASEAKGEEPAPAPEPVPVAPAVAVTESVTRTEAGTVGMVKTRGFQILDRTKIPIQFWTLNESTIAKVYRAGGDVPGCVEDVTYAPRTR